METYKSRYFPVAFIAIWLFVLIFSTGCSSADCMVADVITPVHEAEAAAKGYKLVIITTGMQDKIVVISLFKMGTKFDDCGKPDSAAYDEVVIENGKKVSKINITNNQINLEYSSETGVSDFRTVPVEFK